MCLTVRSKRKKKSVKLIDRVSFVREPKACEAKCFIFKTMVRTAELGITKSENGGKIVRSLSGISSLVSRP